MSHIGKGQILPQSRVGNVDNIGWLELLEPFTAVKNLYLTKEFASSFAHALQGLSGERAMVLPALEKVFIESQPLGSFHEAIEQLAVERQLSGHLIGIHDWDQTGSTRAEH